MEENPFPDFKIDSTDFLDAIKGRSKCSKCNRSRKYYCYTCYVPVPEIQDKVPKVKLPLKVDIIKHPSEVDGKSTAVHAGVIAPDDVTIYTYPVIPDYTNKERVVLVFPGENSVTLDQLSAKHRHSLTNIGGKRKRGTSSPTSNGSYKSQKVETVNDHSEQTRLGSHDIKNVCDMKNVDEMNNIQTAVPENSDVENCSYDNKDENTETNESLTSKKSPKSDDHDDRLDNSGCDKRGDNSEIEINDISDLSSLRNTACEASDIGNGHNGVEIDNKADLENGHIEVKSDIKVEENSWCIERVVFIDSTWNQTKSIFGDERLKDLQCVQLEDRKTKFWRHHNDNPDTYLSTIEAIYYFVRDYHTIFVSDTYNAEYDNLLFFFTYMYKKIRHLYDGGGNLLAYKKKGGQKL